MYSVYLKKMPDNNLTRSCKSLNDYTFNILGGSVSNALGSIAVVYSSLYLLFGQVYEQEDEAKTCVTGAATGMYYKIWATSAYSLLRYIMPITWTVDISIFN